MYTKTQKEIISHSEEKVRLLFQAHPVPAHGFDHIQKVRDNAVKIARAEGANVFLCELSALLHDIGRAREKKLDFVHSHQEISYRMSRNWFKNDNTLNQISAKNKKVILYAVRYHWNDAADKNKVAIILRDADKLDTLGKRGADRIKALLSKVGENRLIELMRVIFAHHFWLRTNTARQIARDKNVFGPIAVLYRKLLRKKILPVRL